MLKHITIALSLFIVGVSLYLSPDNQTHSPVRHVIYITLDGNRWQDVLQSNEYFPKLKQKYSAQMQIYGIPGTNSRMEVASIPVSLPSYQSQMTGAIQPCDGNECGQVRVETLPEYLVNKQHYKKQDVAVFSSWPVIAQALESKPGTVYSNVGNLPVVDPVTGKPDAFMEKINHLQTLHKHIEHNRLDEYTFAQSLHYFEKYQPKFLWISLVNADNEAHMNHLKKYHETLSSYDNYLDQLFTKLKEMNLDKETMVIITTDHGRGNNAKWVTHGPEYPESRQTWAMVMNGKLQPVRTEKDVDYYNTLSIRPAIEKALL